MCYNVLLTTTFSRKMVTQGNILDPSWMRLVGDFNEQVATLFSYVRLTRDEVESLRRLFSDVENTLRTQWASCEVIPFGSIVTGMGIKTSDVDCYVHIPAWQRAEGDPCVQAARAALRRHPAVFRQLLAITHAKVPIVKFLHAPTATHCDLSFKSPSGVRNSKLICHLLHLDRRALDLAILVKYWSKVHNLTGTNLVPNYTLTLLVIFYLQQRNILPPVCQIQKNAEPYYVDRWNTAFDEHPRQTDNEDSLFKLLGGFFAYYSVYDFDQTIVSPYLGYPIVRERFKKASDVPEEFGLYIENLSACGELKLDTPMCVQDPFDHARNCSVAVFPKLGGRLRAHLKLAAATFEQQPAHALLAALLRAPAAAPAHPARHRARHKVRKPQYDGIKKKIKRNFHAMYAQISKRK